MSKGRPLWAWTTLGLKRAGGVPGPLESQREGSPPSLGYVHLAWRQPGICHQLEPWVSGVTWREGEAKASSTEGQQGLPGGR